MLVVYLQEKRKLVAHLSDGSAADYTDIGLNIASGIQTGQTLTITFVQNNSAAGSVALDATTLP